MSEPPSATTLVKLIRQGALLPRVLEGQKGIDLMAEMLVDYAHPEFVTVMVPKEGPPVEYRGAEGFREALSDWISPYERFRLLIEEVIPLEDELVFLARQLGTTRHGGVEVDTESASVWGLLDNRIRQATFYLDRRAGLWAAGLDPDKQPQSCQA